MKNKESIRIKGFTLIELLATIFLLAIIVAISFAVFINLDNGSKEKLTEVEKEQIVDSAKMFYTEFSNTNDYLSYVDEEIIDEATNEKSEVKKSCISLKNLIDKGFYKKTNENILKRAEAGQVVLVKEYEDGNINYSMLGANGVDEDGNYPCSYWKETDILDDDINFAFNYKNDKNSSVIIVPSIKKNNNNTYTLSLTLTADTGKIEEISYVPVNVTLVLDNSGSMSGTKYSSAVASSIDLSKTIINSIDQSEVALINFSFCGDKKRDFAHQILNNSDFSTATGLTNIPSALKAARKLNSTLEKKAIKYIIFLTDGLPEAPTPFSSYSKYYEDEDEYNEFSKCKYNYNGRFITDACKAVINKYADEIKKIDNSTLVVIGYSISNALYKTLGSKDLNGDRCPNSNYSNYCYYESNSSSISSLFSNITNTIKDVVKAQSVSKTDVKAIFNKYLIIKDKDGNDVTNNFNVNFNIENSDDSNNSGKYSVTYSYTMELKDIEKDDYKMNADGTEGTYEMKLFDDFNIILYGYDNNIITPGIEINKDSIPTLTITRTLKSYLN